jgi:photosystem II stability/assembly factor-like uncharacterized protein
MTTESDRRPEDADVLRGRAVTALAISPTFERDRTCFAATLVGLFCSTDGGGIWRRLGDAGHAVAFTAVVVSPGFAEDGQLLVAGLEGGVWSVTNGGASWTTGDFRGRPVEVSALALSPEFGRDGTAFAATMEHGVFVTRNRGALWEAGTFGLLDLDVTALAVSPRFARDETLFAATASGLFRSPNGGRAWREVGQPGEGAVVQCLACSPDYGADGVLYAGTELNGLFRSEDRGITWQPVGSTLPDPCVNAVALSPRYHEDHTVLIATNSAVYLSRDAGHTWSHHAEAPDALCLAITPSFSAGDLVLVGLAEHGVLRLTQKLLELTADDL